MSGKDKKKKPDEQKLAPTNIKKRSAVVVFVMAAGFMVLILMLVNISLFNHDRYSEIAINQQLSDTITTPNRGNIYDRNMNVLATSATVWTVALSPLDIKSENYNVIATKLSEILDVDYDYIYDKFDENTYYSEVKKKVDQPIVDQLRAFLSEEGIRGVNFYEDSKRYYPYGNFAAQVLGFVGTDNYGLYGLEAYYDSYLAGTPGRIITAENALQQQMGYEYETEYEAQDGQSLVLTIDAMIQYYVESALETGVKEHNVANRGCAILMNVKTGEILAMATKNDFDPNDPLTIYDEDVLAQLSEITDKDEYAEAYALAQQDQWNNKAINELYEAGSVFKAVTSSAALESGACTTESHFYCSGSHEVIPGLSMNCANSAGHGDEDFSRAIINSCNPAFIQINERMGANEFYKYFKSFGFTEKTGIDLPGEAQSLFYTANQLGPVQLASSAYGQSNSVTPLQMITAFAAVVNGGYLVTPYIVSEVLDTNGNVVESHEPEIKRQVISNETSETMCEILEQVVVQANGRNAYVAGYRLAGKSGTSQKLGGDENVFVASFCAAAPADDPEIVLLVLLDEAQSFSIYGSALAGPIIAQIMSNVLPYLGIDSVYGEDEQQYADAAIPNAEGLSVTQGSFNLLNRGFNYTVYGENSELAGAVVTKQYPPVGTAAPKGSTVILYTDENPQERMVEVPSVAGRTVESATAVLRAAGLNIRVNGSTASGVLAVSQSYAEGERISAGTVVTVEFVDNSLNDDVF